MEYINTDTAPVSSPTAHASTITVYESYHSALHEITQPDKLVVGAFVRGIRQNCLTN